MAMSLVLVVLIADAALGRTPEMPRGLLSLASNRVAAIVGGDANTSVRQLEDKEVGPPGGRPRALGVGLTDPIGVNMGSGPLGSLYTVHNSYYATYGRLGLIGLAGLLWMCVMLLALGVKAVRSAEGPVLVVAFAGFTGVLRAVLSAWTQTDLSSNTGIVALAICAALLLNSGRHRGRRG